MEIEGAMESSDKQLKRCFCIGRRCEYFIPVYLFLTPELYHIVFSSSVMYFATSYQGIYCGTVHDI